MSSQAFLPVKTEGASYGESTKGSASVESSGVHKPLGRACCVCSFGSAFLLSLIVGRCPLKISLAYGSSRCSSSCGASPSYVRERLIGCYGNFPVRILASRRQQRNLGCAIVSVDDDRGWGPGTATDLQHQILAGARRPAVIRAEFLPVVLEQLPRTLKVERLAHGKSSPTHSAKEPFHNGLPRYDDCCVDLHAKPQEQHREYSAASWSAFRRVSRQAFWPAGSAGTLLWVARVNLPRASATRN